MFIVNIFLIATLALFALFALWVLVTYNGFVRAQLRSREAWSAIDVQIKRRADLVPNLVETVRGYASHEQETLEGVIRARGALVQAQGTAEAAGADHLLTQALGRLFAVVEAYPQLKASNNFTALQKELSDIEEKVAFARQFYNRNVLDYNTRIEVFPQSIIANVLNLKPLTFFEATDTPTEVKVSFKPAPR